MNDERGMVMVPARKLKQLEEEKAALIEALRTADKECEFCKHANAHVQACEDAAFECGQCTAIENCRCCNCTTQENHWEWCGLPEQEKGASND